MTETIANGTSSIPDVFAPAKLGPVTLRNRVIKAATFEGVMPKGLVTDALVEYHRRVARGGVGMTTVAYLAVAPEGRTDRHCIHLRDEAAPGLRVLTDAIHEEGAAIAAQIGHAGPVANSRSNGAPSLAPSNGFSALGSRLHGVDEHDITRITDDYSRGARMVADTGFDSIEIHLGHNYLLSAFLSPKLNKRTDRYGGTLENRARFPRQVVKAVRDAVGDRVAVTAKVNMADGTPGGFWLNESVEFARMLQDDGALDALELTGGSSLANPMYLFRGEAPIPEFAATQPQPIRLGMRLFGKRFLIEYPWEEAYFLQYARQFRAALDMPLILLGGINRRETMDQAMRDGFAFVAMARALLREPDLLNKMQKGASDESLCIHCNKCMPTIYSGTRCVLVDPDPPAKPTAVA
ncbi:MAG TPA: NADH:flavin oxidoreductase [Acidimicrobiia bacterium]|nr:NADH:flavin oxidoreductase [Acidimicrobiia bacterium]